MRSVFSACAGVKFFNDKPDHETSLLWWNKNVISGGIIVTNNDEERLKEILKEKSSGGKITCTNCHEISEEHSYSLEKIGELADQMELKIVNCKLGCF